MYGNDRNIALFGCLLSDLNVQLCAPLTGRRVAEICALKGPFLSAIEDPGILTISALKAGMEKIFKPSCVDTLIGILYTWRANADIKTCHAYVRDWYQIFSFAGKIEKEFTQEQERQYLDKFFNNEETCRVFAASSSVNDYTRVARIVMRQAMSHVDLSPRGVEGRLRHGPGAVLCGEKGAEKFIFSGLPDHTMKYYPVELFVANASLLQDLTDTEYATARFPTCRLALVPKDYRGPRGVFTSQKEVMMLQLAQDDVMKEQARRSWLSECWNPQSQVPSQEWCVAASVGGYATLDLSDASDRITPRLLSRLMHRQDYLYLMATRPCTCHTPRGEGKMRMFAPMGDGKTFSVLTYVVATLALSAMIVHDGARPYPSSVRRYAKKIRVFGDDLIVPSKYYGAVCDALEIHNLKVNNSKSFYRGSFRESCGLDAIDGVDITPVRCKVDMDAKWPAFVKCVALHNRLAYKYPHLRETREFVRSIVEWKYPYVWYTNRSDRHPFRLLVSLDEYAWKLRRAPWRSGIRFNDALQRLEVLTYGVDPLTRFDESNDWWLFNHWLMSRDQSNQTTDTIQGVRLASYTEKDDNGRIPFASANTGRWGTMVRKVIQSDGIFNDSVITRCSPALERMYRELLTAAGVNPTSVQGPSLAWQEI